MPNTREKLIELLDDAFINSDDNYGMPNISQVADHLIANGVTIPVRCKECKCCTEIGLPRCRITGRNILDDDFCSRGERRNDV